MQLVHRVRLQRVLPSLAILLAGSTLAAQEWVVAAPATLPPARNAPVLVYDVARQVTVMFGGAADGSVNGGLQDTWTWNGLDWTEQFPATVPPTRVYAQASYDLARGVVVMFGGRIHGGPAANSAMNDLWEWNGTDWTSIQAANMPPNRYGGSMCYDAARGVHVLFSGVSATNASYNDTWEYNGATQAWTQVTTATLPGGRVYGAMVYDFTRSRCVLYGGADDSFVVMPDVFWEYDGVDWTAVVPANSPGGAQGHAMAFDMARSRVVIQGGQAAGRVFRVGTWEYDGTNSYHFDAEVNPAPAKYGGSMTFDWTRSRAVVFAGYSLTYQRLAETLERDPAHPGFATYGAGCAHAGGTAAVALRNPAALGSTYGLDIGGLPSTGSVSVLFGFSNATWNGLPLPFPLDGIGAPGCALHTDVVAALPVTSSGGAATFTLVIPTLPALAGLSFYNQAVSIGSGGLHVSDAAEARMW